MEQAKVRGVVHVIEETKTYGERGFQKRLVVLEQDDGRYTNFVPLELTQARCSLADEIKLGDHVEASYRLRGRKWQKDDNSEVKYFLSADVLDLQVVDGDMGPPNIDEDDPIPF